MTSGPLRSFDSRWQTLVSGLLPADRHSPETVKRGHAGVLMALTNGPGEPDIVLTRRAAHLQHHPSEIAFPGGKWESRDINLVHTALRESFEETGLPSDRVQILGRMGEYRTLKDVAVTPVVGVIPTGLNLVPDPAELDVIFLAPLGALHPDRASRWNEFERDGVCHRIPVFQWHEHTVWGLTAAMGARLAQLYYRARE